MYAQERQQAINQQARSQGRVDVASLAEEFEVTTETVRRDLTALERQGLLRRVHGGAIPIERLGFEPAVALKNEYMVEEKERIAKAALDELPDEGAFILDSGTTTGRLAEVLPLDLELTVVTNSIPMALLLSSRPKMTVLLLGGRVRGRTLAAVDIWAVNALAETFAEVAFMGTNGVSVERGLTTPDPTEAAVKRAMMAAARRVVVLADHTKLGNDHLIRFGELADVDTLVTDTGADDGVLRELESSDMKVRAA